MHDLFRQEHFHILEKFYLRLLILISLRLLLLLFLLHILLLYLLISRLIQVEEVLVHVEEVGGYVDLSLLANANVVLNEDR